MHIKKRGGQVAIEFIFLIAIAFSISIIFTYALVDQAIELNDEKEFVAVQDISFKIQNEIKIASEAESGYARNFELPETIQTFEYNISIINTILLVTTKNKQYVRIVPQIEGNMKKGWNRICRTDSAILLETGSCVYS